MNEKKKQPKIVKLTSGEKTKKLLTVISASFVGFVLLFGIVLGAVSAIITSSYVVFYKGTGIDSGSLNYLSTYYKAMCIRELNLAGYSVYDDEEFWSDIYDEDSGETFGEYLQGFVLANIKELLAAAVVFDMADSLKNSEKEKIADALDSRISYLWGGDRRAFSAEAEKYGFDYKDAIAAAELLYKKSVLGDRLFGDDGTGVFYDFDKCEDIFSEYRRVKFIFIRTETVLARDEDGNPIMENGASLYRALSDGEREERLSLVEEISTLCENINSGAADPLAFDEYAARVKTLFGEISNTELSGYYLHPESAFTNAFAKSYPDSVMGAMELDIGECCYVPCTDENGGFAGACFMYRDEIPKGEYPYYYDNEEDGFFGDFTSIAKVRMTDSMVSEVIPAIQVSEKWDKVLLTKMPYTTVFIPSF